MGVEVKVRLLGHITKEEIMSYIYNNWDKNVKDFIQREDLNDWKEKFSNWIKETYDDNLYSEHGFITFNYNNELREIFYNYNSYNAYENLNYYSDYGLGNMVKSETTYLSLSKWGEATEIMKELVSYFGGWIDFNDSDDELYVYIPSNYKENKTNKLPIIHMTREELNNHFGGIVIINK